MAQARPRWLPARRPPAWWSRRKRRTAAARAASTAAGTNEGVKFDRHEPRRQRHGQAGTCRQAETPRSALRCSCGSRALRLLPDDDALPTAAMSGGGGKITNLEPAVQTAQMYDHGLPGPGDEPTAGCWRADRGGRNRQEQQAEPTAAEAQPGPDGPPWAAKVVNTKPLNPEASPTTARALQSSRPLWDRRGRVPERPVLGCPAVTVPRRPSSTAFPGTRATRRVRPPGPDRSAWSRRTARSVRRPARG